MLFKWAKYIVVLKLPASILCLFFLFELCLKNGR